MSVYQALLYGHIAAGTVALLTFWTAAFARKGSPLHVGVGKVYLGAMMVILATAGPMAALIAWMGKPGIATFLAYLVVITATPVWLSRRAIRMKRERERYFDTRFRLVGVFNLIAGLVVFAIGMKLGNALLMGFCWIGVIIGVQMLRQYRQPPTMANWWLREHYGAMLGNGVATHIAFLGIGMREWILASGLPWLQLAPWFLPIIVAAIAQVWLNRRYGGARKAAGAVVTQAG
jgi:hypothetical protein